MMMSLLARIGEPASLARLVFRVTLGSGFIRLVSMGLSLLVGVQLARYLGVTQYGIYGTIIAGVAIVSTVVSLGIPPLTSREAAIAVSRREWAHLRGLVLWSILVVGGVGCLVWATGAIGILLVPELIPDHFRSSMFLALPLAPCYALLALVAALLRGSGHLVGGQLFDILLLPALFAVALAVTYFIFGSIGADTAVALNLTACLAALLAAGAFLTILLRRIPSDTRRTIRGRDWLRGAIPMGMSDVLRVVDAHFSVIVLAAMIAMSDVGLYRVALSCAVFVGLPYSLFGVVAVPISARLTAEGNHHALQRFATAVALVSSTAIAIVLLGLWFVGKQLIVLVFGAEFAGAWPILMVLGLGHLITAANGIAPSVLNATGNERAVTRAYSAGLVAGLTGITILAWLAGAVGAAWAVVLAACVRAAMLHRDAIRLAGTDASITSFGILFRRQAVDT